MPFDAKAYMANWAGFRELNTAAWKARENPYCNGSGPHTPGEVRVMPVGGGGNDILCRSCWDRAIAYRRERNRELGEFAQFALTPWDEGKVYDAGE